MATLTLQLRLHRFIYPSLKNFHFNVHCLSSVSREKTFSRTYSDSAGSNSEDKPVKLSFGRRFLNALKLLALGSKLTVTDAKKMFTLRREATKSGFHLLSGKAPPQEDVILTRAELSFIIQVNIEDFLWELANCMEHMHLNMILCLIFLGSQRFIKMSTSCRFILYPMYWIPCCANVSSYGLMQYMCTVHTRARTHTHAHTHNTRTHIHTRAHTWNM